MQTLYHTIVVVAVRTYAHSYLPAGTNHASISHSHQQKVAHGLSISTEIDDLE